MRRAVVADAGPLYAAFDPSDKHHRRAIRELKTIGDQKVDVILSFSTLAETYSLILHRFEARLALRWLNEISSAALVFPTLEDSRQAAKRLADFSDQSITLFDATLAAIALRMRVEVWTYDHHFDVMRVPVWRSVSV